METKDLKKLLEPMEYKMRAGPGGSQLAYIDARQAQDRLDEVCGPDNWKVEYKDIHGGLFAGVSIRILEDSLPSGKVYEWITKWDGGTESNIEKEKGLISDSFKRACVCWGIGRFLYSLGDTPKKKEGEVSSGKHKGDNWFNDSDISTIKKQLTDGEITIDNLSKHLMETYSISKVNAEKLNKFIKTYKDNLG